MKKLLSIAILACGLMLSGCGISEEEVIINLEPVDEYRTRIIATSQSDMLRISDIVINRGSSCKASYVYVSTDTKNKWVEINQERVNVLIEQGMKDGELKQMDIYFAEINDLNRWVSSNGRWVEKARQLNLYHPFEVKFGEQLVAVTHCRFDSILEIVLKTDKGELSYDFKN